MNGLAEQEDRLRFDVLTKTKSPELHRYWTTRAPAAANRRLFRLVAEVLQRDRGRGLPPEPGLALQGLPLPEPVLGVGVSGSRFPLPRRESGAVAKPLAMRRLLAALALAAEPPPGRSVSAA
jgi:hypothetical protein